MQEINIIVILGTAAMLFLAIGIIVFIVVYQRKMFAKQNQISKIRLENQEKLIKAEIDTKEREQRRIAQELHDDIGASLSSMRFIVGKMDPKLEGVKELGATVSRSTQSVRRISNDLLPHVLEELSIKEALGNLVNNLECIPIDFTYTSDDNDYSFLEKDVQLAMFRIVQELINNIMKYAEAKNVTINLSRSNEGIMIVVSDDGNGNIPEQYTLKHPRTLGLKNIQSRVQYIGGSIKREKNPQRGTKVTIIKPLV